MSRKRGKTDAGPVSEPDKRPVNVKLSPAHHKLLRMVAADAEMSMSEYASLAVVGAIESDARRKNIAVAGS